MMIQVDSNNDSNELKELLLEFQSLFGALEIDEDTTAIDIIDEDLITSGITDSLRLAHQSKQEKEKNRTVINKHLRDDKDSDEIQVSNKRLCSLGHRNRSGIRRGYEVESESSSISSEDTLSDNS